MNASQLYGPSVQVNPPYYVSLVEVVPAPWTEESVVTKTRDIMKEVGQVPVCFKREIEGFALNRIQRVSWTCLANTMDCGLTVIQSSFFLSTP